MTRLEAIEEEIKKLTPGEVAELRRWLDAAASEPERQDAQPEKRNYTWLDIHRMLFPNGPPPYKTIEELREAVDEDIRQKYARR